MFHIFNSKIEFSSQEEMVVGNGCWLFGFLFEISFRCERELNAKTARGEDKPDGSITTTVHCLKITQNVAFDFF